MGRLPQYPSTRLNQLGAYGWIDGIAPRSGLLSLLFLEPLSISRMSVRLPNKCPPGCQVDEPDQIM